MKSIVLPILIVIRLLTNDGIFLENRRPKPKFQTGEVKAAIHRPWKRGEKLFSRP